MLEINLDSVKDINVDFYGGDVNISFLGNCVLILSKEESNLLLERLFECFYDESISSIFDEIEELNSKVHSLEDEVDDLNDLIECLREKITYYKLGGI